jgi:hypothetical protein
MKIPLLLVCTFVALTEPTLLPAQDSAKQTTELKTSVGDITDNRTTGSFNSECKVELKFTGDAAASASVVRAVRVKRAVDDLDRDLLLTEDSEFSSSSSSSRHSTVLKKEVRLRNPSRHATLIKVIEGDVELFNPTVANGGIFIIKNILNHPAEPVDNPTLKKYGIQMMYLTKETYEAKKKQIEQAQKTDAGGAIGDAFGDLFKGMMSGMMGSDSKNAVKLYVKDPDKRIISVEYQDANGKPLKTRSSWSSNELRSQDFDTAPPADAQLLVQLATPESTQTLPFKVENIPLP